MNPDKQYHYWNSVAEQKTFTHPLDLALLEQYVSKSAQIIDYGCGYGRLTHLLASNGYTQVTGYDTSAALIERGTRNGVSNLHYVSKPDEIPLPDGSVDCVVLFAVLTCIPPNKAQRDLVNLLYNKLKPGGILYISDYYLQTDSEEIQEYEYYNEDPENFGVFTLPEGATFRHHTQEWIAGLLRDFTIKEERQLQVTTMNGNEATAFQIIAQKRRSMHDNLTIRLIEPEDAAAALDIYRPYVQHTAITFEHDVPDVAEFESRIKTITKEYPWLVCLHNDEIIGYAYGSKHRYKTAYQWSPESTIYVAEKAHRKGVARVLYSTLFSIFRLQGYYNVYAGVTLPNENSEGFHRAMGFEELGTFKKIGYKLGKWHDTQWFHLPLMEHTYDPPAPRPINDIKPSEAFAVIMQQANAQLNPGK